MARLYTRPFVLCALANFAQAVSFSLFLHFPGFLKELGARESEIGVLVALTALSAVALGPCFGRLMDRRGRRPVIIGGNLLNVGVVGLYLTLHGLSPALYIVRILHGLAGTMLYSALFAYAADIVPCARTAQGLALFGVSAMLSITAGGVIGDAVLVWGGYQAVFLTSPVCAIIGLGLALPLVESSGPAAHAGAPPRAFRATLCQSNLVPLWLVTWMFFFAQAGVFAFLKTYVMATGFGTLGAVFTVYTLTAIVQRLALAIYTTIDDGAVLVAGPLLGFLIETMGYAPMFRSVAGLLAGTTVLFWLWDRGREEVPA